MMETATGPFQRPHSRAWEEQSEDHLPCRLQIITHLAVSKLKARCFINRDRKGGKGLSIKSSFRKDSFYFFFNLKKKQHKQITKRDVLHMLLCVAFSTVSCLERVLRESLPPQRLSLSHKWWPHFPFLPQEMVVDHFGNTCKSWKLECNILGSQQWYSLCPLLSRSQPLKPACGGRKRYWDKY